MKGILPVTLANLRRGKSQSVSLFIFVLIAAMLLNLGLLLMTGFNNFFDRRSEELHAPHYALAEEKQLFTQKQVDYLKAYPGVTEVETEPVLTLDANTTYNGGEMPIIIFLLNTETQRQMNDLTVIDGRTPQADDEICLPYMFEAGGGYKINDKFTLTYGDRRFTFKISGFTEEIMFGSINNQMYQAYLSPTGYSRMLTEIPEMESVILRARLQDPSESQKLSLDCAKEFFYQTDIPEADSLAVTSLHWSGVKLMRTMMPGITAMVLVVFAAIIIIICLLVIRFRIHNSIEESMTNIGALKAMGYTGRQLLWATTLQFCSIAVAGIIAGIGLSYAVLPTVSHILELQTALKWQQGFDPEASLISLVGILLAMFAVTCVTARRLRKLQPLTALRQGLVTHSFKRNHFPLDRTRGALPLLLALKSALQAKGQMVMIFIIVATVSFAATSGLSIYGNLGVHPDTFAKLLSGELPDAAFIFNNPDDARSAREYIEKNENVRKIFYYQNFTVMIEDIQTNNITSEDFSLFEGSLLYEGRYPKHDNEICVSGSLAEQKGLAIGEAVNVVQGGQIAEYLIVGLIQTVNNAGIACAMTIPGALRIQSDYHPRDIYVYLKDNTKTAGFVDSIQARFEAKLKNAINLKELMDTQLSMYGDIFRAVAMALVTVTALVIFLVLYLMMKTIILRRRRELGIQKALGFTTLQLMNQFALYFIPVITFGVAAGAIGGILGFNPIFVALTRSMGIMTASMPASLDLTIVMCGGLILLTYAIAMLIAWRIRKISAYALVTE